MAVYTMSKRSSLIPPMNVVKETVFIDGEEVIFDSLTLLQGLNDCQSFELIQKITSEKELWLKSPQKLTEMVGNSVLIRFEYGKEAYRYEFSGYLTEVLIDSACQGSRDNVIRFVGQGKVVVLEDTPSMNSFVDQHLVNIVKTISQEKEFGIKCCPKFEGVLPFAMQYKESSFAFLNRLSAIYNELFFYDGKNIVFGCPENETPEKLIFREDISQLKTISKSLPYRYSLYNYSSQDDEYFFTQKDKPISPENGVTQTLLTQPSLYPNRGILAAQEPVGHNADTQVFRQGKYQSTLGKMHFIEGQSDICKVRIGGLIQVGYPSGFGIENSLGIYRVISVHHKVERGSYSNTFRAVPEGMEYAMFTPTTVAYPEIAEVVENQDPEGQGRVKVRFYWQRDKGSETNWIRVQSSDAGVLSDKSGNRGVVFVPEVGDQVMVGFEYGNPHCPFVMGSMFHKTNASEVSNNVRSITTKSGCKIVFDDNQGSVLVKDKMGSSYLLDGQGNVEINAINNMSLCAGKNISLSANNDFMLSVGNTAMFSIFQKMLVNTPYMQQLVADYFHTQAGKALINSPNQIKIEAQETNVAGTQKLFIHSEEETIINSKGTLTTKGEKGNKWSNQATSYETVQEEIQVKCLVHFRPKKGWKGEDYGFDWMRVGDTNVFGDDDYKTIVAKQYVKGTSQLQKDPNEYDGDFEANEQLYTELAKIYKPMNIAWKIKKNRKTKLMEPEKYFSSWLSLYPSDTHTVNTQAVLSLYIEIEEPVEELRFEENEYLTITPNTIDGKVLEKGKTHKLNNCVTITCNKEFAFDQEIRINAITKNSDGTEKPPQVVGRLFVWANHRRTTKKILILEITTPPISGKFGIEAKSTGEQAIFDTFLRQALIDTEITVEKFDISTDSYFKTHFTKGKYILSGYEDKTKKLPQPLSRYVYQKYQEQLRAKGQTALPQYDCVMLYFGEKGGELLLDGTVKEKNYSTGNGVVLFAKKETGTATHELLHCLGLGHSFSNIEAHANARFTYTFARTENLMDYSQHNKDPRYSLWKWQWEIVNNIKKEDETDSNNSN